MASDPNRHGFDLKEKWLVASGNDRYEFGDEGEALQHAKDMLVDRRSAAGDHGWHPEHRMYEITVSKVFYESRACDFEAPTRKQRKQGYTHACDYQMFPIEEERNDLPFDYVNRLGFVRPQDLLTTLITDFSHLVAFERDNLIVRALLNAMPKDCVSAFYCEGVKFLNETFGDGTKLLYYKNDGCYAVGITEYIVDANGERPPWWDQ